MSLMKELRHNLLTVIASTSSPPDIFNHVFNTVTGKTCYSCHMESRKEREKRQHPRLHLSRMRKKKGHPTRTNPRASKFDKKILIS